MSARAEPPLEDAEPPLLLVELDTAEGIELLIYGPGPLYPVLDVSFVPAELVEEES